MHLHHLVIRYAFNLGHTLAADYLYGDGWPTYKLFDRNGNLFDLKVDARDLDNLAKLLEQMK